MDYSARSLSSAQAYRLLAATVLPRPIALVTTKSAEGVINAAPFSFFNALSSDPPVLALGFAPQRDGAPKDTLNNILQSKEFVVNLVSEAMTEAMNVCAGDYAPGVNELELAQLDTAPSMEVGAPRIALSPVSYECRLFQSIELQNASSIVLGEVALFHLKDDIIVQEEPLRVDFEDQAPVGRLGGPHYCRTKGVFNLKRPV